MAPVPVRSVPVAIVRWDEADSSGVGPLAVSTQTPALEVDLEPFHTPVVACPTTVVVPGRLELRASRQLARRQRRLWAGTALAGMAVTLGATIVVLDVVH